MKIIDENGRLFGKISVIDVLVVLVVAVMAFAFYTKSNTLTVTASSTPGTTITFTAIAENLDMQVADAVAVGDKLYDEDHSTGGAIGTIIAVEKLPASETEKLTRGEYAVLTNPDGANVRFTVECSGIINEGRYSINRVYELGVNAKRNFYTPFAIFEAYVTEIHG
ncbi:MAG: DUF4330 domain-containing protein [Clostridia bacterium]|nr:DUF4330 domain-containing protein [Clostridia bacterium]